MEKEIPNFDPDTLEVEEAKIIPEQPYTGVITKVDKRIVTSEKTGETYTYLDTTFTIKVKGEDREISLGCNWKLSTMSKLGKLLAKADFKMKKGQKVSLQEIQDFLMYREAIFMVVHNENGFAEIAFDTLKFKEAKE